MEAVHFNGYKNLGMHMDTLRTHSIETEDVDATVRYLVVNDVEALLHIAQDEVWEFLDIKTQGQPHPYVVLEHLAEMIDSRANDGDESLDKSHALLHDLNDINGRVTEVYPLHEDGESSIAFHTLDDEEFAATRPTDHVAFITRESIDLLSAPTQYTPRWRSSDSDNYAIVFLLERLNGLRCRVFLFEGELLS